MILSSIWYCFWYFSRLTSMINIGIFTFPKKRPRSNLTLFLGDGSTMISGISIGFSSGTRFEVILDSLIWFTAQNFIYFVNFYSPNCTILIFFTDFKAPLVLLVVLQLQNENRNLNLEERLPFEILANQHEEFLISRPIRMCWFRWLFSKDSADRKSTKQI